MGNCGMDAGKGGNVATHQAGTPAVVRGVVISERGHGRRRSVYGCSATRTYSKRKSNNKKNKAIRVSTNISIIVQEYYFCSSSQTCHIGREVIKVLCLVERSKV